MTDQTTPKWLNELRTLCDPVMCPTLAHHLSVIKRDAIEHDISYSIYRAHGGRGADFTSKEKDESRARFREVAEAIIKAHIAAVRAITS